MAKRKAEEQPNIPPATEPAPAANPADDALAREEEKLQPPQIVLANGEHTTLNLDDEWSRAAFERCRLAPDIRADEAAGQRYVVVGMYTRPAVVCDQHTGLEEETKLVRFVTDNGLVIGFIGRAMAAAAAFLAVTAELENWQRGIKVRFRRVRMGRGRQVYVVDNLGIAPRRGKERGEDGPAQG